MPDPRLQIPLSVADALQGQNNRAQAVCLGQTWETVDSLGVDITLGTASDRILDVLSQARKLKSRVRRDSTPLLDLKAELRVTS